MSKTRPWNVQNQGENVAMWVCEIQMSFQKRCSNSVTSGCTCDLNSGVTCSCLSYAEAKAVLDFHKAISLIHPNSRGGGGDQFKPYPAQSRIRRLPRPCSCRSVYFLDVCCRNKQARKDMGMSELLWDSKGKPRRGWNIQHICITVTARTGNLAAPVDREMERPSWPQWGRYWG